MIGWAILLSLYIASAELAQCLTDLTEINKRSSTLGGSDPYDLMALYSGTKRNSLGDYTNCANLDYADYLIIGFSTYPLVIISLCGSKNCTESDYYILLSEYSHMADFGYHSLIEEASSNKVKHLAKSMVLKSHNTREVLSRDLGTTYFTLYYPQDYIQDHFDDISDGAIVMFGICGLLIAVTVFGTTLDILEHIKRKREDERYILDTSVNEGVYAKMDDNVGRSEPGLTIKLLMCFSLYTNIKKLFLSQSSEKTGTKNTLDIFNGVRAMSMGWVVLGHVFMMKFLYTPLVNFEDLGDWYKHPKGAMIYGAEYAVDVFFWISGFLLAYFFIMEYNAKNRMNWIYIYVHRLYRILPAYMFCLFLTWAFLKYIGNGPIWINGDEFNNDCKSYWWTNLIFLNNFIPDGDGSGCMGWSWYIANDMQFFLITPIILFLYHKIHKLIGWSLLMGLVFTHMLSSALISSHENYSVTPDQTYEKIYIKPYCRVGPYAIGVIFGLIYYSCKHYQKTGKIYDPLAYHLSNLFNIRLLRYLLYLIGLALINYIIFIRIETYHDYYEGLENGSSNPQDYWSQDERNTFYALSRIGFAIGLSLILMPTLLGYNKVAYEILANSVWTPLARLSFCGYLIHYGLIYAILLSRPVAGYLNNTELFYDFIVCMGMTYIAALPIFLMLESPLMGMEKILKDQTVKSANKESKVINSS